MTQQELIRNISKSNSTTYYDGIKSRAYRNMIKQHHRADSINSRNQLYRAEALANYKFRNNIYADYRTYNGKVVTIYTKFKFVKYMSYKQAYYYTYHYEVEHFRRKLHKKDRTLIIYHTII